MNNYMQADRVGTEAKHHGRRKKMDRLTRDVLAAEAAGQSYGQWKADHPHTGEDDPHPVMDPGRHERVCQHCGARFIRRTAHSVKFCCDDCRKAYSYEKKMRERAEANA